MHVNKMEKPGAFDQPNNDSSWQTLRPQRMLPEAKNSELSAEDREILESDEAKSILPYLTLNRLSDHEKAEILEMANGASGVRLGDGLSEKISYSKQVEQALFEVVDPYNSQSNRGLISPKEQEARKLFCGALFEKLNTEDNEDAREGIYNTFFSYSPNFASYVGGFSSTLELLSIAERSISTNNPVKHSLYGEIVYNCSYSDSNEFEGALKIDNPIKQLQLLPIVYRITSGCHPDDWTRRVIGKSLRALDNLANNQKTTPLVRLISEKYIDTIREDSSDDWVFLDELAPEQAADLLKKQEARERNTNREQNKLHKEFKELPNNRFLTRIAPGIAGATNSIGQVDLIASKDGKKASLSSFAAKNDFGIEGESSILISTAHNTYIKEAIDKKLGLNLSDISLEAQIHLLKFMTEANNGRFDKLCATLNKVDEKLRLKLAEGFLATDFGEDFGDSLLEIANSKYIDGEKLEEILDTISSCRESIQGITGLYGNYDGGEFAHQYTRAANERLTDAIYAFLEIGKTGQAWADLKWAGNPKFDYSAAIEALKYGAKSLSIINGVLSDVKNHAEGAYAETVLTPDLSHNRRFYNLYSPNYGYMLIYTRPEGSHLFEPNLEYGKHRGRYDPRGGNMGVEASISMIADPVNPFNLMNPYRPGPEAKNPKSYDETKMNKVSAIRLDREGRTPKMKADDPRRDVINQDGMVSVDLAAIGDRADTPSGKIARLFSVGNKLRQEAMGVDEFSLNHNTNHFDHDKYGSASGFLDLVDFFDRQVLDWCRMSPPKKDEMSYTKLKRDAKRRVGRKTGAAVAKAG